MTAERDPELAVLSCIVHGSEPHAEVLGRAALIATLRLSAMRVKERSPQLGGTTRRTGGPS
jgi:hypothetical protein